MIDIVLNDSEARERALNPSASFLVQAPAGSGKTSLLVERYLALLSVVNRPEEILAITFTRKAAAEMRERVLSKLLMAIEIEKVDFRFSEYEKRTYLLAKKAFERDQELNWGLLNNPNRLQILTIDSFCSRLVSVMPVASGFGGLPNLIDDASELYKAAVNQYFKFFLKSDNSDANLETLLLELNNDFDRTANLLITMLAKRDQWLNYVTDDYLLDLDQLNIALEAAVEQDLAPLNYLFSKELREEIVSMCSYAAESLRIADRDSEIRACNYLTDLPHVSFDSLDVWRGIKKLLLTDKGTVRSRVSIAEGFAPESSTDDPDLRVRYKEFKKRMQSLLTLVKKDNLFVTTLSLVDDLPKQRYSKSDQYFLNALFSVLKHVTAELILEFQRTGKIDFIQLTQSALISLGYDENPTDLALSFDSRINHILIDEFQDTSKLHFELLRKLTIAWAGDNRSLFIVGDPMQSIYRFRDADVRNFLLLKRHGINSIKPEFLQLESNFRSAANIVAANNSVFKNIFPVDDNITTGDVAFHSSLAVKPETGSPSISLQTTAANDSKYEAKAIVKLIKQLVDEDSNSSIAVLVRSRNHLESLIPLLRKEKLVHRVDGMEKLHSRQEVLDIYALTIALVHQADRLAWLSVLRAPWCGLSLIELEKLVQIDEKSLIIELLQNDQNLDFLSKESIYKVKNLLEAFDIAINQLHRDSLVLVVEGLWNRLEGPCCLETEEQIINVESFFRILKLHTSDTVLNSEKPLRDFLSEFSNKSEIPEHSNLHLLTIHMAKGLEFDHVIIPKASRTTRKNDSELLIWNELLDAGSKSHLLLSQYQPARDNSIYAYVKKRNNRLEAAELKRLLYVAMTRSIKSTTIFCESKASKGETVLLAPNGSFANLINSSKHTFSLVNHVTKNDGNTEKTEYTKKFRRQILSQFHEKKQPKADIDTGISIEIDTKSEVIEYKWASETAMHVGTVVHLALNQLAKSELEEWALIDKNSLIKHYSLALCKLGVPNSELEMSVKRVVQALQSTVTDSDRRWIFSAQHREIENEYPISGFIDGQFKSYRLDRTFIDTSNVRWIIDYKTSIHEGSGLNEFLDNEVYRYRLQLENYAKLMKRIDNRQIMLGMYFPLMQGWREWEYA